MYKIWTLVLLLLQSTDRLKQVEDDTRGCTWKLENAKIIYRFHKKSLKIPKGGNQNRISKKNRQHNGQKKKYKRTNNDLQNIHIKLKIE
jgi:hypothetical protein